MVLMRMNTPKFTPVACILGVALVGGLALAEDKKQERPDTITYIVNVADDGVGVQKKNDESSTMGKSFGLTIMRERAARLNGKLSIESRPAGGTVIRLVFPQRQPQHNPAEPVA